MQRLWIYLLLVLCILTACKDERKYAVRYEIQCTICDIEYSVNNQIYKTHSLDTVLWYREHTGKQFETFWLGAKFDSKYNNYLPGEITANIVVDGDTVMTKTQKGNVVDLAIFIVTPIE